MANNFGVFNIFLPKDIIFFKTDMDLFSASHLHDSSPQAPSCKFSEDQTSNTSGFQEVSGNNVSDLTAKKAAISPTGNAFAQHSLSPGRIDVSDTIIGKH